MKERFGIIKLLMLCLIVGVFSAIPTIKEVVSRHNVEPQASAFQGVITIWNVDTFEGGSASKSSFLEAVVLKFKKANNGVNFLVKNITPEEMKNYFLGGITPDILSFGMGIGAEVKTCLAELNSVDFSGVRSVLLNSGTHENSLLAVPYLMGGIALISTSEKLANAGVSSDSKLLDVINSAGYEKSNKKGTIHISSVVAGKNNFVDIKEVLGVPLTDVYESINSYEAYVDFVSYNKGTILLGTHRDVFKISGRVSVGKINDAKIEYISGHTSLVQYAGLIKSMSPEKVKICNDFLKFLVLKSSQKLCTQIGMFNVIKEKFYENGEFAKMEEVLNSDIRVPNLF